MCFLESFLSLAHHCCYAKLPYMTKKHRMYQHISRQAKTFLNILLELKVLSLSGSSLHTVRNALSNNMQLQLPVLMSWEKSFHRLSDSSHIRVFYENIDTNDSYWIQCIKTRSTENGCRNFQYSTCSSSIREKLENASNLSKSSRCFVEDNNGNDKDWNVGRQGHHPTNHLGPRWVRTTTVLHWLVAHEAEYQDQLTSYNTIGIRPSLKASHEHQWKIIIQLCMTCPNTRGN